MTGRGSAARPGNANEYVTVHIQNNSESMLASRAVDVLYKDDRIVAIDKPHGLLSVPGRGADKQDCASARVQSRFAGARVVHRLDCHTSGVMLMALDKACQAELGRQFHDRVVTKEYVAVVEGDVNGQQGVIDLPVRCDIENRPRQIIDHVHGKRAVTRWKLISRQDQYARLALFPITGRTHQLRVHCASMGAPIVGDLLYGSDAAALQERMLLHAYRLAFDHPDDGRRITIESACDF